MYDSYGKKCNSRFLLNYGFAVENNRDPDGTCHNEVRAAVCTPACVRAVGGALSLTRARVCALRCAF